MPDKTLIEIDQLKNYPPEKTVLITTGSQGESMAALSRMAADISQESDHYARRHGYLQLEPHSGK